MSELNAALLDAVHRPTRGPDMPAARRRARRRQRRRYGRVAATFAAIVATTAITVTRWDEDSARPNIHVASPGAWLTFTSPGGDLRISYPPDWKIAGANLTPHLTDPREVVALGTFPLQPADHNCAHIPVNALEQMGPTDGFIWITERAGTSAPTPNFGPRPTSIGPTTGTDANGGDLAACLDHPLLGTARAISFDDHGRHFTISYAVGSDATAQRRDDILAILNSFQVG
jgi:hypothetical protein